MEIWTHGPVLCALGTVNVGGVIYTPDPTDEEHKGLTIDTVQAITAAPLPNARNVQ